MAGERYFGFVPGEFGNLFEVCSDDITAGLHVGVRDDLADKRLIVTMKPEAVRAAIEMLGEALEAIGEPLAVLMLHSQDSPPSLPEDGARYFDTDRKCMMKYHRSPGEWRPSGEPVPDKDGGEPRFKGWPPFDKPPKVGE